MENRAMGHDEVDSSAVGAGGRIFVRFIGATTRDAAVTQLHVFREDIVAGRARFEDIAKQHSDCSSAKRGGDPDARNRAVYSKMIADPPPASSDMSSAAAASAAPEEFSPGLRVLIVDDDVTCLRLLEQMLRRCRYRGQPLPHLSFRFHSSTQNSPPTFCLAFLAGAPISPWRLRWIQEMAKKRECKIRNHLHKGKHPLYAIAFNLLDSHSFNVFATIGSTQSMDLSPPCCCCSSSKKRNGPRSKKTPRKWQYVGATSPRCSSSTKKRLESLNRRRRARKWLAEAQARTAAPPVQEDCENQFRSLIGTAALSSDVLMKAVTAGVPSSAASCCGGCGDDSAVERVPATPSPVCSPLCSPSAPPVSSTHLAFTTPVN